jgi:hypothetical protein
VQIKAEDREAIDRAYLEGASDTEVAKILGITKRHFKELYEKSKDFQVLIDKGRTNAEAWWEEMLRTSIKDKNLNVALATFVMKNKFGWADKVETTTKDVPKTDEELAREAEELRERLEREVLEKQGFTHPQIVKMDRPS